MSNCNIIRYDLPVLSDQDDLQKYIRFVSSIPNLDIETEKELIDNFFQHKDVKAAQILVQSHLKLVVAIAAKFKNYGFPLVELIAEGNFGLVQGIKKFRPEVGARLSTYATWWIKAAIQEYVVKSWSLVKIGTTAAQKKIFFNLSKVKKKILGSNRDASPEDIIVMAEELSVPKDELKDMISRMESRDLSLNDPIRNNEGVVSEMIDIIPHHYPNQEMIVLSRDFKHKRSLVLTQAVNNVLNDRQRLVIEERYMVDDPKTLTNLAKQLNISTERVRQIEEEALRKLKKYIELNDVK